MNVIFGAGGFAREVGWLFHEIAQATGSHEAIDAFVAHDNSPDIGMSIGKVPVLSESSFFSQHIDTRFNAYLGVGSPKLRRQLFEKCSQLKWVEFPPLLHPSVLMDRRPDAVRIGRGAIVCAATILTTSIAVGEFAHLNLACTIGHDVVIGDYCTLSPGVRVSGKVSVGSDTFVGTGAVLLENINVCASAVIGAGATVVRSITGPGTYIGTPARLRQ